MDIAIVAVAYNRVDSLGRLLGSLEHAYYNEEITLIISVDKSNNDVVERYADEYQWHFGNKIVDKHEKNLGLRPHMMSLGKWFDCFDAIVVLEDDIVVSPSFFYYTKQAVSKYYKNPNIAGVSLYSIAVNYQTGVLFEPIKDEHDAYFMNCAMSWGEVWMRDSWRKFYDWYLCHQEFSLMPHLPYRVCSWNNKSWLKYHTRYCIEENKFFVHPYTSLTSNYGDAGVHSKGTANTVYQVPIQNGIKEEFFFPDFGGKAVYYDGFFENTSLYEILDIDSSNLCLDLYGEWNNRLKKRYWLTTKVENYKIVKSFGLNYRPIEANVILDNPGKKIFLYDTSVIEKNNFKKDGKVFLFHYHLTDMYGFVRKYGYNNTLKDYLTVLKKKIGIK